MTPNTSQGPPELTAVGDPGHLSIEETRFHGDSRRSIYDQVVSDLMVPRTGPMQTILCQMIARSYTGYETAIHLQHRGTSWVLVVRRALVSLGDGLSWRLDRAMDQRSISASLAEAIEEAVRPISASLASDLQRIWTEMLLRTRPRSHPELDLHASYHHFAHHHLAGVTMQRGKDTFAGRFVGLGNALLGATAVSGQRHEAALADVEHRARAFLNDLSQLPALVPAPSRFDLARLHGAPEPH